MWMVVFFDLPVVEKKDRKNYTKFRNFLLDKGFTMAQFSVYYKCLASKDIVNRTSRDIENNLPPYGSVQMLTITDKQYENIISFSGRRQKNEQKNEQYLLF